MHHVSYELKTHLGLNENARPWILFLWVSYYIFCVINITFLCCPVFLGSLSHKDQLLIKRYMLQTTA